MMMMMIMMMIVVLIITVFFNAYSEKRKILLNLRTCDTVRKASIRKANYNYTLLNFKFVTSLI